MSKPLEQRPPHVTLAAVIAITASVMVVMSAWGRISNLRSLKTRESVEEFLAGPGAGLGLGHEDVLLVLHVSAVLAAVCAAAVAVLGWFVMQGDKAARIALTVAAVPLFLTGLLIGDFASSFVGAAAVLLWIQPAREWFATGRWTPPAPRQEKSARDDQEDAAPPPAWPAPPQPPAASDTAPHDVPPPHPTPYATQTSTGFGPVAVAQAAPVQAQAAPTPTQGGRPRRPGAVVAAFVVTVVSTVIVLTGASLALVFVTLTPELVMDELERQASGGATPSLADVRGSVFVTGTVTVLACLAAMVLAGFGLSGRAWGRRGWVVVSAVTAGVCLVVVVTAPAAVSGLLVLVPFGAAITTLVLLRRSDVRRWFESGGSAR